MQYFIASLGDPSGLFTQSCNVQSRDRRMDDLPSRSEKGGMKLRPGRILCASFVTCLFVLCGVARGQTSGNSSSWEWHECESIAAIMDVQGAGFPW